MSSVIARKQTPVKVQGRLSPPEEVCFKDYLEKLWGIPCTEISADWEAGKFRYTSFLEILKNAMIREECRVKFPRLGSRQLYERIANFLVEYDRQILFNHEVKQIHHENFKVTQLTLKNSKTGEEKVIECKGVISSIPLSILLQQLTPAVPSISGGDKRPRSLTG